MAVFRKTVSPIKTILLKKLLKQKVILLENKYNFKNENNERV